MKKVHGIFAICLLLGLATYNATLNIIGYDLNYYFKFFYEILLNSDNESLITIFILIQYFLAGGIISFTFSKLFNIISRKCLIEEDLESEKIVKNKKILFIINVLAYSALWFIFSVGLYKYNLNAKEVIWNWYEKYKEDEIFMYWSSILLRPQINAIIYFIVNIFIFFITSLPIYSSFKKKNPRCNPFFNYTSKILLTVLLFSFLVLNIYNYVDIDEFNYVYYIDDDNVICGEYSDIRKIINKEDYVIPEKIWFKEITSISAYMGINSWLYPDSKIIVPNTISWNKITGKDNGSIFFENVYNMGNELIMNGEMLEWFVEDNDIYSIDKSEICITGANNSNLYIPSTVKNIYGSIIKIDNDVQVDSTNEYYFSYDGALYTTDKFWGEEVVCGGVEPLNFEHGLQYCFAHKKKESIILPDNIVGEELVIAGGNISKIVIPKSLNKEISFILLKNAVFEVEEGNKYYCVEEGNLYNKDKTKLIYSSNHKVIVAPSVKDINERLLKHLDKTFEISQDNPYIERVEAGIITYK